ncbi:hypothetical protein FQB35_04775 [Crassaminicella thermophila]|uniref:Uncharacterized protein n=1 Tax=Crassaminicella thermophila TaxID=2599308 RepID=A0A5C0SCT5_CRATE|nr:hypothetical protein [Crassaminicella thermophila]QEK11732.1 hypothetical protein FQB35_04775 [Crassaminicella thermophila]
MEKILQQILNELKIIKTDINNLKESQLQTNERLDNIEVDIKHLKQGQTKLEQGQTKLEQGQTKLEQGQKEIKDHLVQLDTQNADRHMEAFSKIKTIDKEVKFIKHKLHQTEEDVFDIKDHLKLIK